MSLFKKFRDLFGSVPPPPPPTREIPCPFCHHREKVKIIVTKCNKCNLDWPVDYLKDLATAPPLFMPLIGFSGSGKTVYLYALIHRLTRLGLILPPGYTVRHQTKETRDWIQNINKALTTPASEPIRLPKKTVRVEDTIILRLAGLTHWQDRQFVIRDLPGERCRHWQLQDQENEFIRPFIANSNICCMAMDFSRDEAALQNEREGLQPQFLFEAYARIVENHGEQRSRTVIVVLTKGDRLIAEQGSHVVPANLANYCEADELAPCLGDVVRPERIRLTPDRMAQYRGAMLTVSDVLRDRYVANHAAGTAIINAAKELGVKLYFTLVTGAGCGVTKVSDTSAGGATEFVITRSTDVNDPMSSRRVLDPFFLALDGDSEPVDVTRKALTVPLGNASPTSPIPASHLRR